MLQTCLALFLMFSCRVVQVPHFFVRLNGFLESSLVLSSAFQTVFGKNPCAESLPLALSQFALSHHSRPVHISMVQIGSQSYAP